MIDTRRFLGEASVALFQAQQELRNQGPERRYEGPFGPSWLYPSLRSPTTNSLPSQERHLSLWQNGRVPFAGRLESIARSPMSTSGNTTSHESKRNCTHNDVGASPHTASWTEASGETLASEKQPTTDNSIHSSSCVSIFPAPDAHICGARPCTRRTNLYVVDGYDGYERVFCRPHAIQILAEFESGSGGDVNS